jgi:hypothetical protein
MVLIKRLLLGGVVLGLAFVVTAGCTPPKDKKPAATTTTGGKEHAEHHDYLLFHDEGETYHIRIKIDKGHKKAEATIYDGENKERKPIEADSLTLNISDKDKAQIVLKAQREQSDPKGKSSRFVGEHERLAAEISPEKTEVAGKIAGKHFGFKYDTEHHPK